jgi:hypothetical protein
MSKKRKQATVELAKKAIDELTNAVKSKGLPKQIGSVGFITQTSEFVYKEVHIANEIERMKGWIYVDRDKNERDEDGGPSYTDIDSLISVIKGIVYNLVSGTHLEIPAGDDSKALSLNNNEASGSRYYEFEIEEDEFNEIMKEKLGDQYDEDDRDISSFLWDHCVAPAVSVDFDLGYGWAYAKFDDGTIMGFTQNGDHLVLMDES